MSLENCKSCGQTKLTDTHDFSGCPNILCESQLIDKCPYCGLMSFLMGDCETLFNCQNLHVWSYH